MASEARYFRGFERLTLSKRLGAQGYKKCVNRRSSRFVQAWDTGAYATEDFVRDRVDPAGHFISPNRFSSLLPDQRDGLTDLYRGKVGDIHHDHVHADQPDNRRAATLNQDRSTMGKPSVIAVGIADRQYGDARRSRCDKCAIVADGSSSWNGPYLGDRGS